VEDGVAAVFGGVGVMAGASPAGVWLG